MFYGLERLIDLALGEDIATGDITTDILIAPEALGRAAIFAKEPMIVAGLTVARRVFKRLDAELNIASTATEGQCAAPGDVLLTVEGRMASLLTGERTALNFLQRLSGIATHVRRYVDMLEGVPVRLVDTRKTTPGWRSLEKYAVRIGGAANHRFNLSDGILIKDNHIAACGGIAEAVGRARDGGPHSLQIEVETATLAEVETALAAGADIIMLDNMEPEDIRSAVRLINGRALVEISGGVDRQNLAALATCGADIISVGALTHAARAVDISMRIEALPDPNP
ncbi:MAG: carboxylating nicotinate-nucleotide diphosphorylase [Desulfobacterales bacterium]|nr:carboxylating nicotinate-nucleotide diphosphorylase [Desulfobacterales bacterium]